MDLKDFMEKSVNFGLGLAAYSKEKIEELVEEMVQRGDVAQKDARSFAGDLVKKGEEQRHVIRRMIREEVDAALKEAGVERPDAASDKKSSSDD